MTSDRAASRAAAPADVQRARLDPEREGGARHGIAAPRGLSDPGSHGARFTRMFPFLAACDPGDRAVEALAQRMLDAASGTVESLEGHIPAAYTYLGQFVDHDITFDPTSKIDGDNDPDALVNFRTPRLDLDSLYGSGPADQPFLYDWDDEADPGVRLLVGRNPPDGISATEDLPRNWQGRATIGDGRNDEHLIIAQLHLLMMRFHNAVVDGLRGDAKRDRLTTGELFDEAHRSVRWHYQWLVVHDFLEQIIGASLWETMLPRIQRDGDEAAHDAGTRRAWHGAPAIPIEFSAAAYRFGHSMVRRSYRVSPRAPSATIVPPKAPSNPAHLGGFRRLPKELQVDWPEFLSRQKSLVLDHLLAKPLFTLPPDKVSLARLNLQRGRALGLPCGTAVARAMGQDELSPGELLPDDLWPDDGSQERKNIVRCPPLWFYLLREAHAKGAGGTTLGPTGGRIVAEVLVGLLEADPRSYLHHPTPWRPNLGPRPGTFELADLVSFAPALLSERPES